MSVIVCQRCGRSFTTFHNTLNRECEGCRAASNPLPKVSRTECVVHNYGGGTACVNCGSPKAMTPTPSLGTEGELERLLERYKYGCDDIVCARDSKHGACRKLAKADLQALIAREARASRNDWYKAALLQLRRWASLHYDEVGLEPTFELADMYDYIDHVVASLEQIPDQRLPTLAELNATLSNKTPKSEETE